MKDDEEEGPHFRLPILSFFFFQSFLVFLCRIAVFRLVLLNSPTYSQELIIWVSWSSPDNTVSCLSCKVIPCCTLYPAVPCEPSSYCPPDKHNLHLVLLVLIFCTLLCPTVSPSCIIANISQPETGGSTFVQ